MGFRPDNMSQNDQKPISLMTSLTKKPETQNLPIFLLQTWILAESFEGY